MMMRRELIDRDGGEAHEEELCGCGVWYMPHDREESCEDCQRREHEEHHREARHLYASAHGY